MRLGLEFGLFPVPLSKFNGFVALSLCVCVCVRACILDLKFLWYVNELARVRSMILLRARALLNWMLENKMRARDAYIIYRSPDLNRFFFYVANVLSGFVYECAYKHIYIYIKALIGCKVNGTT